MVWIWRNKKYWRKYTIRRFTKRKWNLKIENQIYGNLINDYWIHKHTLARMHTNTRIGTDWIGWFMALIYIVVASRVNVWSIYVLIFTTNTHARSYLKLSNLWRNVLDFYDRYRNCLHKVTQHSQSTDTRSIWIRFGNGCVFCFVSESLPLIDF